MSISASASTLTVNVLPTITGRFEKSSNNTITVSTDNFTGYSLFIETADSTNLVNANDDEIPSISSAINEATFATSSSYNNKWGYKPSQYITTSGNVNTVVQNSNYLPAPSTEGDLLAVTSAANASNSSDSYTLSFGVKVDMSQPSGEYEYTYVLRAVANTLVYNITYDKNTSDTVGSMPSPNPQAFNIDGGTPTADSYVTLSSAVPTLADKTFGGWCDVTTTHNSTTDNDECSGNTYAAGANYPIDQTIDGTNITLYAIWLTDPFPTVWSQMGKCIFDGAENDTDSDPNYVQGSIHGSECQTYMNKQFIDTGIALYSSENYQNDYEVHFTIDKYIPNDQPDAQTTIFNDKLSSSVTASPYGGKSPGIVIRRSGGSLIEIKSTYGAPNTNDGQYILSKTGTNAYAGTDVRVFRINDVMYYSIDNGPLISFHNVSAFNQPFGLSAWFGAYPDNINCTENCTQAKRFLEGELSNMYIKLGDFDESNLHEIIFDENYGSSPTTTTYLVLDGDTLSTLPAATRTDWIFGGWWTATTSGTERTAPYTPSADEHLYAHWYKSVSEAQITNSSISLSVNDTETIQITNSSDLEPYTFSSSNASVATVSNAGVVTATGNGTATITMTGTVTGDTKTITVLVGSLITVTFDPDYGSEPTFTRDVTDGGSFDSTSMPTYSRTDYELEGWYTGQGGTGTKLTTATVFGGNTPTTYYANWIRASYVCRAGTKQHSETCNRTDSNGCRGAGYANGAKIEYGSLIQSGATSLVAGNALTCDINYDGTFDEDNERFYYYATNGNNAELIYYKNISNAENVYADGLALLPTSSTTGWTNPGLVVFDSSLLSGDYTGKVARFMSYEETVAACNNSTSGFGANGKCLYILEASNFANTDIRDGFWIGRANHSTRVHTSTRKITDGSQRNGVRPVIEVPLSQISLAAPATDYTITFDPHNGTSAWDETVTAGDTLGSAYPATDPTYSNHIFQGWYTAASGGTLVTSNTEPSGNTTYHAQWLKTVALAELSENTIMTSTSNTATINVTNVAELEPYTFTSNDTSIATVDSTTGVVTGVTNGSTSITMTGTISGATKTINVIISNLLPVTQATLSNNDLTLLVGDQMNLGVSNASQLEQYTLSSQDSNIATVAQDGTITGVAAGTTNIILTGNTSGLTKSFEVNVVATQYMVTFNTNGGVLDNGASSTKNVSANGPVGTLPTASRTNYKFFGWYTDNGTFYDEVYPETVVDADITYYAKWEEDTTSFPIVWSEINECTFTGTSVTGTYCGNTNSSSYYIDTNIQFFTAANYNKDFEVGFTITDYNPANQLSGGGNQATFVSSKKEDSVNNYPGFVIRRYSGTNYIEITSRWKDDAQSLVKNNLPYATTKTIKLQKRKETEQGNTYYRIYYSINGGAWTLYEDVTNKTYFEFNTKVWFGGAEASNGTSPMRPLVGKMTDMYVKLGTESDYLVELNANGGTLPSGTQSSYTINMGDPVGALPTPTAPNANYTFGGWYDGNTLVSDGTQYIPTSNVSLVADWIYQSSDTPVTFDVSNNATRGYKTLANSWAQSPVNLTTFNEASPINNSTWGDTTELSELQYWTNIRSNFVNNQCMIPSYGDAANPLSSNNLPNWVSGSVDCSKPDVYDTLIGEPLNVYLYNNQTLGAQVAYAEADDGIIRNLIPGNTYKWVKDGDSSIYGYITVTSNGSDHGTRWVDTGTIRNVRDIGGLPADTDNDGTVDAYVDYGRLFRGEKLGTESATELTSLGINKEYNVGDEYTNDTHLSNYQLSNVIHYDFDYTSGDENNASSNYMKAWNAVTDIMTDVTNANDPKNVYVHCRVGADRTGTVMYLLEGLLGVPDEERYQEYSLTNLSGLYDRTRYYKEKSSSNNLKFVYMMGYVKTTADILTWYNHNPNADANLIAAFKSAMTTPIQSQQQQSPSPSPVQQNNNEELMQVNNTPMSLNEISQNQSTEAGSGNESSNIDSTNGGDSLNNYSEPLGVSEDKKKNNDDASIVAEIAIATVAMAVAGGAVYALSKDD